MTGQRASFQSMQSSAGVALAGIGAFLLYAHLTAGVARFSHVLATGSSKVLALVLDVTPELSQVLPARAADRCRLLRHVLVSCWPILLVVVGMGLAWDSFTEGSATPEKK